MSFLFGGKKPQGKPAAAMPRKKGAPVQQKRGAFRAAVEFDVFYTLEGRAGERRAVANDLSSGGLRFVVDEDLLREQEVELRFTLPSDFLANFKIEKETDEISPFGVRKKKVETPVPKFVEMKVRAKALITFFNLPRKLFMHGMQFVAAGDRMEEEIQRFNHYWQLNEIRERSSFD